MKIDKLLLRVFPTCEVLSFGVFREPIDSAQTMVFAKVISSVEHC